MKNRLLPDEMLVEQAQRGDMSALDDLINRYRTKAYYYAFRITRNEDLAADMVATAFVRMYRAIGSFKCQCAFSTWMYRIITNCYLDVKRKEARLCTVSLDSHLENEEGNPFELQVQDESSDAFEEILKVAKNQAVERALSELPDYQRVVLTMFHVEMLSYEEMAETLDLPMGTIKSRLNRARVGLSQAFVEHRSLFDEYLAQAQTIAA